MAVDTRDKRGSAIGFGLSFRLITPNPDGSLTSAADRAMLLHLYSGIVPTPPVVVPPVILARVPYQPPQAPGSYNPQWMRDQFATLSRALRPEGSRTLTTDGRLAATDNKVLFDAATGAIAFTLLPANQVCFQEVHLQKLDVSANAITLVGVVSGVTNPTLATQYQGKTIYSNGNEWLLVATV